MHIAFGNDRQPSATCRWNDCSCFVVPSSAFTFTWCVVVRRAIEACQVQHFRMLVDLKWSASIVPETAQQSLQQYHLEWPRSGRGSVTAIIVRQTHRLSVTLMFVRMRHQQAVYWMYCALPWEDG